MTLKNNSAPLPYHVKLCASFQSHQCIALQSGNAQFGLKSALFGPNDLEISRMTLKNYRAPLLSCFKLCVLFRNHWWIQTGVTIQKRQIWVKIDDFFKPWDLEIWRMTLKNNIAHILSNTKHPHMRIQTGVTVRKRINGVLTSLTLTFSIWPWPFVWTSLFSMVITPENFLMIQWEEHTDKLSKTGGRMDRQTDERTEMFLEPLGLS